MTVFPSKTPIHKCDEYQNNRFFTSTLAFKNHICVFMIKGKFICNVKRAQRSLKIRPVLEFTRKSMKNRLCFAVCIPRKYVRKSSLFQMKEGTMNAMLANQNDFNATLVKVGKVCHKQLQYGHSGITKFDFKKFLILTDISYQFIHYLFFSDSDCWRFKEYLIIFVFVH